MFVVPPSPLPWNVTDIGGTRVPATHKDFVKKVYLNSVEGTNRRGRPLGRWEDRLQEYVSEREVRGNVLEWARRECMDRERWRSVCCGYPLEERSQREEVSELLTD